MDEIVQRANIVHHPSDVELGCNGMSPLRWNVPISHTEISRTEQIYLSVSPDEVNV
jgi:hypothetical protein